MDIKTGDQPGQFSAADIHDLFLGSRPFEPVFFKPFLPQAKTVLIPIKDFEYGTVPITKYKQMARENILLHLLTGNDG